MVNQNLGITIYRVLTSTVSGIMFIVVGYVLMISIDSIIFDKFPYNDIDNKIMNNLETLISKPWIYLLLPIAFFVGEIFNMLGEFMLFYFFRFTYRGKDMISIYTKYDSEREYYSFSRLDLINVFGEKNQYINVSELLYSTARFLSGLTLILFVFVFFNVCLFKIYSLKSLYSLKMENRLSLLYLFLLFFGILIFILLVSPLIISWNKIAKLLDRVENRIKTSNSGKSKIIFLVIFSLFFIHLYYLEKIVSFFYKIPYLGPFIIIIILIFSYLLFLYAIENEKLFDKNPYLTRLIFYIYFVFIHFFIVANSFLINEKDKSLQTINLNEYLNKDLTVLLLRIIIYWFFLTHSFFISLLFKMKKYIHINIFFISFIIMYFIFWIFFKNEIELLIFQIGLLVQLNIPLLIILAFILKTMANEIIFYILKSQKKSN